MEPRERNRLRDLQDRYLASHDAKSRRDRYGDDHPVAGPGTPTFRTIEMCLLPMWEHLFKQFLDEE